MDPSENVCVEFLRPKTVPDNLVALGTVSQISDIQLKIQIAGGIVCLVDRYNINQAYTDLVKSYESRSSTGKSIEPPRLSNLFKKGQQYVCKIIDRRTRKGYADAQDIIASLDPVEIQEDNIPTSQLSIPNVPLQCAIVAVEDHGYRVEIGFKNITGFLNFDEAEDYCDKRNGGKKFSIGQIVRCVTKSVIDEDSRVIQLTLKREFLKKSSFSKNKCSENTLTPTCILPGSIGFLTVMKVQKDGLIVNFLDEFAGFVSLTHLREDWQDPRKNYKIADNIKCIVLYYNRTTNTFSLSLKSKKKYQSTIKQFNEKYHVGQFIDDAQVVFLNGLKTVNFRVDEYKALSNVRDAIDEDVTTLTKDELHIALDKAYPEGSKHKCRIKSINYADLILVLSMRQEFLNLTFVSIEELQPADFLEATVKKYVKDGIVVSFGLNLRAIILNCHLHDYVSSKSYKRYPIGMTIKCRVLKVDFDKQPARVYLTNKEQLMDAEMTIIDSYDKSFRGETVSAIVYKLKHDGIIVELFNNVKGFIPRRFCSTVPIKTVSDLFQVGQVTTCTAYRIEPERQSLVLGIIPYERIMAMKKEKRRAVRERQKLKELNQIDNKIGKATNQRIQDKCNGSKKRKKQATDDDDDEEEEEDRDSAVDSDVVCDELVEGKSDKRNKNGDGGGDGEQQVIQKVKKSRLERSIEAKQREERIREAENALLDPNRQAQSVADFERLVLKSPNSGDVWIKYSKFFLDNVETEKARLVCRRALKTINFRMEKEKLKLWLQLIKIEAKYGGIERLREIIDESAQTNDTLELYRRAAKALVSCNELDEAERLHEATLKLGRTAPDVWVDYVVFLMEHRKDMSRARDLFDKAHKSLTTPADSIYLRSRFAHLEFKHGDVERGKTLFENLLSEHPKRMDLWNVYKDAIKKFGTRQLDTDEVHEQNEQILRRIASLSE